MLKEILTNRAKYVHVIVVLAATAATMWAENAEFRAKVTAELGRAPHWLQGLAALAPFVWAIYKQTAKELA
jgi:hypothetical protein